MATSKPYPEQETAPAAPSDQVAEALSPYIARTENKPSAFTPQAGPPRIAGLPASAEVWRFAQENALVQHLETSIRLIHESFKHVQEIKLTYEIDPEIPNLDSIAINFYVTGSLDDLLRADRDCIHAFASAVPNEASDKIVLLLWPKLTDVNKNFDEQ
jgi:hypothetical protein